MKKRRIFRTALVVLSAIACSALLPRIVPLPAWCSRASPTVLRIDDREGGLLAARSLSAETIRERVSLDGIDPVLVRATLAAEDRRFFRHPGIDPIALSRALWGSIVHRRPIGGASTITMQLVRFSRGRPVGFVDRLREVAWSLVVEAHLSKREILEEYLTRAPYGGTIAGVAAASRRWFGKSPAVLAPAEAALLAALPRAPGRCHPVLHPSEAIAARNEILRRMGRLGWIEGETLEAALKSDLGLVRTDAASPSHLAEWLARSLGGPYGSIVEVRTSIDPSAQAAAERAVREGCARLRERGVAGGAVVVLDSRSGEVLAMVGSPDFSSPDAGQVNAALAPRQPGSAVKPFVYAAAFAGALRPSTILADVPVAYGDPTGSFAPRNYAETFQGPVSARLALANSWNVPSVEVAWGAGVEEAGRVFHAVGLGKTDPLRVGLGITLGVGEATLLDLAGAYATLARGGRWIEPHAMRAVRGAGGVWAEAEPARSREALDPIAAAWVNEILSDPAARGAAFERGGPLEFPGPVAAKTGTSARWRDAWAVLYTTRHTVAVWMGNPDGRPTDRVTGAEGPGTVAREVLLALEGNVPPPPFPVPPGIERRNVCPLSGRAAGGDCPQVSGEPFREDDPPLEECEVHVVRTIDTETRLLARTCTPPERRARRLFARLPARFAFWQADLGLEGPPTSATVCLCGSPTCTIEDRLVAMASESAPPFRIVRPLDGSWYLLDPTLAPGQQEIALEAEAPPELEVEWRIDGETIGTTRGTHRRFWPARPGSHHIEALLAGGVPRASTRILVAAGEESPPEAGF